MQTFKVFLEAIRDTHMRKPSNMTLKSLALRSCASILCDLQQVFVCVYIFLISYQTFKKSYGFDQN